MATENTTTATTETDTQIAASDSEAIWNEIKAKEAGAENGAGTTTTEKTDGTAASSTEKTPEELAAEKAADIWANATPEQKTEIEALRSKATTLEHENQSHRGRQSALMRAHPEIFQPNGEVKPKPQQRPAPKDGKKPSIVETEEFKQLETELPEVAKPMKAALTALTDQVNASQARLDQLDGERRVAVLVGNEQRLTEKHPDWDPATESKEFADWYAKQPAHRLAIINANKDAIVDVDAASEALAWFKADTGWKAPAAPKDADGKTAAKTDEAPSNKGSELEAKRALQREGADAPKTTGPVGAVSGIAKDGDPETIWNQIVAQEKAEKRRRTA